MSDIYKKLIRQTFLILKKYDKAMDLKMTHCFFVGKNFQKDLAKMSLSVGIGEKVKKVLSSDIEN